MNKGIRTITAAMLAMMCVGMSSCGDDNDEPGDNGGTSDNKVNPATVFTQGVPSQVGDLVITKNAQGLVTMIVDDDEVTTFDYTPAKSRAAVNIPTDYDMTMSVEWGNDEDGVDFYITLNDRGYVAYAYEVDEDKYDGVTAEEWWFKYDDLGRMIEMKRTEGDNEVTTVTYNAEGDIVKVSVSDDVEGTKMVTTVAYTDAAYQAPIVNKSGIMIYDDTFRIDMDEMAPAYFAGLLGKGTAHLPLSGVEKDPRPGEEIYTYDYTFAWELNSDNMPVKLTCTEKGYWGEFTDDPIIFKW